MLFRTLFLLLLMVCSTAHAQDVRPERLMVVWVEGGRLLVWQEQDTTPRTLASGDVIDAFIAPGGASVAYRHGDGSHLPTMLTVIAADGSDEALLVDQSAFNAAGRALYIANVAWGDSRTLYFNTTQQARLGLNPQDDLWRVSLDTGDVEQLFAEGEGGAFSISPDGAYLAVVQAGTYGDAEGRIRLLNLDSGAERELLTFASVSTAADYAFYPQVFWVDDGLYVPIPDPDLIYNESDPPPTALWYLSLDGAPEQVGTVSASFFGQPRWSDDGAYLLYLQRAGRAASNTFHLVVASGDGSNPAPYETGNIDALYLPDWLPGAHRFVYSRGEPGVFYVGAPEASPARLPEIAYSPAFVDSRTFVYAASPTDAFDLRYARLGSPDSGRIARVQNRVPIFDARMT